VSGAIGQLQAYRTKAEAAAEAIRDAIYAGRLAPGTRLTLRELEEELGLSITPIREALQLLQSEGLVAQEPHRGFRIAAFDAKSVDETYWLRAVLEPLATRLATPRLTAEDLAGLRELQRKLSDALAAGDPRAMQDANRRFHMLIYGAAGQAKLAEHIELLWRQSPFGSLRIVDRRPPQTVAEHAEILQALEARDADAAERSMYAHIEHARAQLVERLEQGAQP